MGFSNGNLEAVSKSQITSKYQAWAQGENAAYMGVCEDFDEAHNAVIGR